MVTRSILNEKQMMPDNKLSGIVKWYNIQRGYGVIEGKDGNEYFVRFGDELDAIEYGLETKPHVTFRSKQRKNGKGLKAFDVEITKPPSENEDSFLWKYLLSTEGIALRKQEFMKIRRWNLWEDYNVEYGEFQEGFNIISQSTQLQQIPASLSYVRRIFYDDIPDGAWPTNYDRTNDLEGRMGAYTQFRGDNVNLIVHAFYRNRQRDYICWRARGFRKFRDKVYNMPPKNPPYERQPASWRMSLDKFLSDVHDIIDRCRLG